MLGLLKRTCPLLTETKIRRSLYLSLVKSQLCYGTEIWSPSDVSLKIKIERIQRRATRWILRSRIGELSYKERLQTLDMLPLCYVREIQDLVFFYKALHGYVDVDISNCVSFINHNRSRLTLNPSLLLQVPLCRTTIHLRTLTLIEQFIYGTQCVEQLYLTTSGHYLVLRTFFIGLTRLYVIQFLR